MEYEILEILIQFSNFMRGIYKVRPVLDDTDSLQSEVTGKIAECNWTIKLWYIEKGKRNCFRDFMNFIAIKEKRKAK